MRVGLLAALAAASIGLAPAAQRTSAACRAAVETVNWIRETLAEPGLAPPRLERLLAALELRTGSCPSVGDLWFYRSVIERALGKPERDVAYSLAKAREFGAPALGRGDTAPLTLGAAAGTPAATFDPAVPIAGRWAVTVGIGAFADDRVRRLPLAAKDARDVAAALTDPAVGRFPGGNVRTLVDQEATLSNIRQAIGWLRQRVEPDDLVVLFFASHGSPREVDPNGVSYILTADTDTTDAATLYGTSLQMIDLVESINRDLRARRVVLLLDTCYSGAASISHHRGLTVTREPSAKFSGAFWKLQTAAGRAVVASSQPDEQSWESGKRQNGYFTHFLVEGLRDPAVGPRLADLFTFVRERVSTAVRAELGRDQHPVLDAGPHADQILLKGQAGAR